jgi:heme exporter protein A
MSAAPAPLRVVRCEGVKKRYGDELTALRGVSLSLQAGEITSILGANGAGKSTLLGVLSGAITPSEGRVVWESESGERPPAREQLGLIAHATLLYGDLTGRENLRFYARLYGQGEPAVEQALDRCHLARFADREVRTYSRGMAQRAAIARALVHRPELLLCDEPYTGLDPAGAELLTSILREEREQKRVVVLVTHDLGLAVRLSDRIAVLRAGSLAADLRPPFSESELLAKLSGTPTAKS